MRVVAVAGAGERFVKDRVEADFGRRGCCTLLLHLLGWFEPAASRLQDAPVLSKQVVYLAISAHKGVGRRRPYRRRGVRARSRERLMKLAPHGGLGVLHWHSESEGYEG